MFRWKKDKDKEKEDKKKKDKKDRKDRKSTIEKESLTADELKRLDEVRRSFTSSKGHSKDDSFDKQSNSSDYSLNSPHDTSPSASSMILDPNKSGSPSRKPPPIPKKPTLLVKPNQSTNNVETTPSPQGSTYSMASLHLGPVNLTNEMLAFMDQMNNPSSDIFAASIPAKPSVPSAPPSQVPPGEQGGYGMRWKSYASNLRLPPVTCLPAPVRTHSICKNADIFPHPSNAKKTSKSVLWSGERLLKVNEISVENKSNEEISELIKSSDEPITITVQTVPELREITRKSDCDTQTVENSEQRSGSLSPGSNMRFRGLAKSEEEMEVEKAWLSRNIVWIVHKGGFSAAHLVKSSTSPQEGKLCIKTEFSQDVLEVNEEDVEKANPPQFDFIENVAHLRHVNESSVLHTLRQRYCSQLLYTFAGNILITLNPIQPISAYSEMVMKYFKSCRDEEMPPHIYAVAQNALTNMLRTRKDQSVILQGRSGSGKTSNFRHLLQYLVTVAGSSKQILTAEKLKAVSTLLEAFGNCRTVLNSNATRFTELFTIDFDHSGQIISASVQAYMLERSRVGRRPEGEPNFNIFYYLLAGADETLRKELRFENLQDPNLFMTPLQKDEDQRRACLSWSCVAAAFQTLGAQNYEVKAIWYILGAIYHLGVASACKGSNGRLQFLRPQNAQKAASLLGCSVEDLAKCIFSSDSGHVSGKVSPRSNDGTVEATECLQAMVSSLYAEVFSAMIYLINRSLSSNGRSMASFYLLDCPGFQNPATCGRVMGAALEDLCHNYCQERLQSLFHDSTFLNQQEKYLQENIEWNKEEYHISSPAPLIDVIDHTPQQGAVRASTADLRDVGKRGLIWLLDEESLFPGASEKSFLDKLFMSYSGKEYQQLIRKGPYNHQFTVQHFHGTNPVVYSVSGWLRSSREHPASRQTIFLLQESQRECINQLFSTSRGVFGTPGSNTLHADGASTLRRSSSMRRAQGAGVKRRSVPLQVKYTMDGLIDLLRRTNMHFVQCFIPRHNAGIRESRLSPTVAKNSLTEDMLNIPLLRSQIRGFQVLDTVRVHKQGFPENLMYSEFRRRFEILAPAEHRVTSPVYDERKAAETLLESIDLEKSTYRLGLSQIFLRSGVLAQLEAKRDQKLNGVITSFQASCRGYLARRSINKLKVQELAICCIQRNVRKFLAIRSWPWWRLYVKILPLLDVHRTEEDLRLKTEELDTLKAKLEKLEKERNELKITNDKLEVKVSELWSELSEEQSTATHASEMLEAETSERMRLEKEVHELQNRYSQVQQRSDKMEMEMMENRMFRSPEINGDLSDEDETDGKSSIYKQKYERAVRDMEIMKRRMQQLQEEEMEQKAMMKKASEKRLADALEDVEEERQVANQWKRKAQKLGAELQDLRLMLEEQMGRNGELEKKQRKFDAELSSAQEEIKKERILRDKLMREKDQAISEKYTLEQELQSMKMDSDMFHEKISQLNRELDELTLSSKGEEEVTQLKRTKQELERKARDQEEELEELAAQVQMLEQAKLRLEMSLEKVRQEHRREASVREEEIEEIRASFSKKIKNLEAQLESEQDERHQLMKQKHELERRIYELADQPPPQDPEIERRLRRDLKRTKALLRDAQSMLEHTREGQSSKTLIRQLKNQLEDSEFAKVTAVKARQAIEAELQECQSQLEEVTRVKNEAESRCLQLSREKSAIQTQLEEAEEEMAEVMKKYKAAVAQMSIDQKTLAEQNQQIAELESERQMLKDQLSEVSHKFEHLAGQSDDTHKVHWLDSKIRDLESKLELEQTTKTRLENQIARLKEQNDRSREECDSLRNKEMQAQEGVRRLQRQVRDLREDYAALQQKEADAYRKQHELEMALENTETDLQVTKNDLRLACQRIQDLQNALEDDLDSGTDVPDDSGSDSEDSFELSVLRNQSVTPVQRCDSVASNLSYCTTEDIRSRTSSFSRELSAFSSRDDVEKDVNGLSGVSSRGHNTEADESII
ncbi:unconventional myosin-XVIIIa isoform X1 [Parasteatoda tepidariorum]|uniref:unconventional myosin-XVIIIa isoform X1 n=1 Tax=Parasteatoda tepidariorum TaxID=114398 RepID=UPI0039BD3F45